MGPACWCWLKEGGECAMGCWRGHNHSGISKRSGSVKSLLGRSDSVRGPFSPYREIGPRGDRLVYPKCDGRCCLLSETFYVLLRYSPVQTIRDGRQPSHLFASHRRMIQIRRGSRRGAAQLPNHVCGPALGRTMPEHGLTAYYHHADEAPHRSIPVSSSDRARPAVWPSPQCERSVSPVASPRRGTGGALGS